ncbi:MAG TPA: adenylate/guanylate cyclase domain-containing protein [Candidatus Binatia bacterium]|jgi:class 3 adenylate cyclase
MSIGAGPVTVAILPFPWTHLEASWQLPEIRSWHERLARGRRLVVYDSRGMGLSDRVCAAMSLDALVRDLEAVVEHAGIERFALASSPTAGPVAITYSARHPDRVSHLVLLSAAARGSESLPPQVEMLLALADRDWELYTETLAHAVIGWDAGEYAHRFAHYFRACASPALNRMFLDMLRAADVSALLPRVTMPTLVVHRRESPSPPIAALRALVAAIPDARLVLTEGRSLAPFIGDMESVARAIEEFLGDAQIGGPSPDATCASPLAVLVTDVVGSTALTERLGDADARAALRTHEQIVRAALRAYGGTEVKTMGDGFIASFASVTRALECAVAVQRALAASDGGIRVRMGLSAGEPIAEEGDLHGTVVITASRLAALADGETILVADVVRQLAAGKPFRFTDRGDTPLHGFTIPVRVHELIWRS